MPTTPTPSPLRTAYHTLKATGRGKHVGRFSYYHIATLAQVPRAADQLRRTAVEICAAPPVFNVVKLDVDNRLSFLRYEDFVVPFPALLSAVSCDLHRRTARHRDFASRLNPPILHRKELLLPADHPLVPGAAALTSHLEAGGAFRYPNRIGTRESWRRVLADLDLEDACALPHVQDD